MIRVYPSTLFLPQPSTPSDDAVTWGSAAVVAITSFRLLLDRFFFVWLSHSAFGVGSEKHHFFSSPTFSSLPPSFLAIPTSPISLFALPQISVACLSLCSSFVLRVFVCVCLIYERCGCVCAYFLLAFYPCLVFLSLLT